MPYFAYVRNGTVKYVQLVTSSTQAQEKWLALNRSGVLLKESTGYDVMPGDMFTDGKFYKKDIETGDLTLLEENAWVHPKAVRFAGIMDGEIVGQWGLGKELFTDDAEMTQFADDIVNSEIIEIEKDQQFSVEKGWLYDGVNFTAPDNA